MISAQVSMLLSVYIELLDVPNYFLTLVNWLNLGHIFLSLLVDLSIIPQDRQFMGGQLIKFKLLCDKISSFRSNEVIVKEPVKIIWSDLDVVDHDLSEPSIVSNHIKIDHDDITHF